LSQNISTGCQATVDIYLDRILSQVIQGSLTPEIETPISDRSKITLKPSPTGITLSIEANDIVALRAALNSYLRWIKGILNLLEKLENSPEATDQRV
jgi:tRNA threonylcarbamoyladenosine modification (KEOPS) complex  Pcc1 subunit